MSDSSSHTDDRTKNIAKGCGRSVLYASGFVAVKCLISYFLPDLPPGTAEQAAAGITAFAKPVADGLTDLAANIVASRMEGRLFAPVGDPLGAGRLTDGIETILARAAACSIRDLHIEWCKIPSNKREWDVDTWREDDAIAACNTYLEDPHAAGPPEFLVPWLKSLAEADFLAYPDQNGIGWRCVTATPETIASGKFSEFLLLRWPVAFQSAFADALANDTQTYRKFTLSIFDRTFALHTEHAVQLAEIRTMLVSAPAEWAASFAKEVIDGIQTSLPEFATILAKNLRPEITVIVEQSEEIVIGCMEKTARTTQDLVLNATATIHAAIAGIPDKVIENSQMSPGTVDARAKLERLSQNLKAARLRMERNQSIVQTRKDALRTSNSELDAATRKRDDATAELESAELALNEAKAALTVAKAAACEELDPTL